MIRATYLRLPEAILEAAFPNHKAAQGFSWRVAASADGIYYPLILTV
jgi:hypothetical protein